VDTDDDGMGDACDKQALRGGGEIGPHTNTDCSHVSGTVPLAWMVVLLPAFLMRRRH
jgi:uncharacterized protein (TIGR03382 family)